MKQAPQRVVQQVRLLGRQLQVHVTLQVHEIADAVEEVKEFVRPTREKVRN